MYSYVCRFVSENIYKYIYGQFLFFKLGVDNYWKYFQ